MGRQYSDMTIEELIDHALKYSSRISETDAVIELSQRVLSAQRALDVEREKVKRLSTCGTDHSTPWWQVKCEDLEAQLATLQAQLAAAQNEIDTATDQIPARMDGDSLSVALIKLKDSERDITNQMVTLQAQLRQVEGERNTARHRVDELEAREIDVEILQGDLTPEAGAP